MTKKSRSGRVGGTASQGDSPVAAPRDAAEYARAVGSRVTELVEHALERTSHAITTDPEAMAEAIIDLVLDRISDPDRSELADLVAPVWTAEHTRRVLDLSRPSMLDRRRTGSLLALRSSDGDFFYPVSQFEKRDGKVRVKPALRKFMMALRDHDPWSIAVLHHTPAPELADLTPLEWVRQGRPVQTLVDYARTLNAEFAR